MLWVSILTLSTILIFDFGFFSTVFYYLFFMLFHAVSFLRRATSMVLGGFLYDFGCFYIPGHCSRTFNNVQCCTIEYKMV